jgi:thiol-disulfide isomerase/thioredoxin
MKITIKKSHATITITIMMVLALFGNRIYMNLRPSDPILPGWEEYDHAKFETRLAAGEPMLVEVYASWCPTCLRQHKAFEELEEAGKAPNVRAIRVDFDRDIEFRKKFNLNYTGTLMVFKGGEYIAEGAGLVTVEKIDDFVSLYFPDA